MTAPSTAALTHYRKAYAALHDAMSWQLETAERRSDDKASIDADTLAELLAACTAADQALTEAMKAQAESSSDK